MTFTLGAVSLLGLLVVLGCSNSGSSPIVHAGPDNEEGAAGQGGAASLVVFRDEATGFETSEVHDVDREVVLFDARASAMVWVDGTVVHAWTTRGNDLSWEQKLGGVSRPLRDRGGERRAYFTETDAGTICDLNIYAPDQMRIYATSERPPQE